MNSVARVCTCEMRAAVFVPSVACLSNSAPDPKLHVLVGPATCPSVLSAPCAGDTIIATQADVERLGELRCRNLEGSLHVGREVRTLESLRGLQVIRGQLMISRSQLVTLDGLQDLTSVGSERGVPFKYSLIISDNSRLVSLAELRNVSELKFGLYVESNPLLESLEGLSGVTTVCSLPECLRENRVYQDSGLVIRQNDALTSLAALHNLNGSIFGFVFQFNPRVKTLQGLEAITGVSLSLGIGQNDALESVDALQSLRTVGPTDLLVAYNPRLTSLHGLEGLTQLSTLTISGNSMLKTLWGLRGVTGKLASLSIVSNGGLTSLEGLGGVTEAKQFEIADNAALRTLAGLDKARRFESMTISFNSELRSLSGLEGILWCNVVISRNVALQSVEALGTVPNEDRPWCNRQIFVNPKLESLQIFSSVNNLNLGIDPAPRCFPSWEREVLLRSTHVNVRVLPLPRWYESECTNCPEPCGIFRGMLVSCDYGSGRCRCPLGRGGPGCMLILPTVTVPAQRFACSFRSSRCSLSIQLVKDDAFGNTSAPDALSVYGPEDFLPQDGQVTWINQTHGEISVIIPTKPKWPDTVRVGYRRSLQPDCLLNGTLINTSAPFALFPWCVDSRDCNAVSPGVVNVIACPIGQIP